MDLDLTSLIPIVIALIAAAPGIMAYIVQVRKGPAEMADLLTDTARSLIVPLRDELKELRDKIKSLENENEKLRAEVTRLAVENYELRRKYDPRYRH